MKEKLVLLLFLISLGNVYGQELWKKEGIRIAPPVCYGTHESLHSFIGPPRINTDLLKGGTLKKAKIDVTYIGFTPEAQQAFQYAVEIWQNLIYSPIPIRVKANWTTLSQGVLGSCGPENYFKNFNSTQIWNCYYPVALIEKMLGAQVNAIDDYEISAAFNKDFTNWYFGTDGKTPTNKYDFVSTVLHELAHGLGFSGYFYSDRGRAGYGIDGYATVFDQFVRNKNGEKLVDPGLFTNPSTKLSLSLTSGWLEFFTRLTETKLPRLYAPTTWDDGSSVYHLDDATYPVGDPSSLMTPFTGTGEAIHDPGPNSIAILNEIGWKGLLMWHKQQKDIEFASVPVNFDVQIESDYGLDSTRIYLNYLSGSFLKTDSIRLKATSVTKQFTAQLPKSLNGEIRYYFSAIDVKKKKYVFPSNAPSRYLKFKIGIDKEVPVLKHIPIKYLLENNSVAKIDVEATDNIGIKSVKLEYFVNGGQVKEQQLSSDTTDQYSGNLVFPSGSVKDGDLISYRIVATDVSSQGNIGRMPLSGYNTFYIEGFQKPVEKYVNNFNKISRDFITSDFTIETVSGFSTAALNSAHPYPSPDTDNSNFNFMTILRYPIILKPGGKMNFDEIVLVEPGETGTKYGDEEFWDYVIVEGSSDGGLNWKPLIDGYDSNAQKSWYNLFVSSKSGQNSTAVPTKDLFVKREIDLLANGNFKAGDTIQIRFRLYSDPYSHGWGWIIDNLVIQDIGTGQQTKFLSEGEVLLFPNPTTQRINLQVQSREIVGDFSCKAFDSSGIQIFSQVFKGGDTLFQTELDLSDFGPGLYLFVLEPEKGQAVTRKILIR